MDLDLDLDTKKLQGMALNAEFAGGNAGEMVNAQVEDQVHVHDEVQAE